jgi:hypothetical protein
MHPFILGVLYGKFHPNVGERKFMGNSLNYSQLFLLNGARAVMRPTARASAAPRRLRRRLQPRVSHFLPLQEDTILRFV